MERKSASAAVERWKALESVVAVESEILNESSTTPLPTVSTSSVVARSSSSSSFAHARHQDEKQVAATKEEPCGETSPQLHEESIGGDSRNDESTEASGRSIHDVEYGIMLAEVSKTESDDSLVVATAVNDNLPSALEMETSKKRPPLHKHRRFRLYASVSCMLCIVMLVGGAVFVSWALGSNDSSSRNDVTDDPRRTSITKQLESVVNGDKLEEVPHRDALDWIIDQDPRQLDPQDPTLVQRYLLALFYLDTSRNGPWKSCNPPEDSDSASCILMYGDHESDANFSRPAGRWLSIRSECNWAGVACGASGNVRSIHLDSQEIAGKLPDYFEHLDLLESISLRRNQFTSNIPSAWARLQHLRAIYLRANLLSGPFPRELFETGVLLSLDIGLNQISGSLPSHIGRLRYLRKLFVDANQLSGSIPTELAGLKSLLVFHGNNNLLTGSIPSEFGSLDRILGISLHRNMISGTIPLQLPSTLRFFRAHFTSLEGTIPTSIYSTSLRVLELHNCNMTGTIDPAIGDAVNLDTLRLSNNRFYGSIPSELGLLTSLREAWFQFNDFTGSVPQEMCANRGTDGLSYLQADCAPQDGYGDVLVECPLNCCTTCCNPVAATCY